MKRSALVLGILAAVGSGSAASAATVKVTSNELFIDRGSGYVKVNGTTSGQAGQVVMAMNGGAGVIIYADGCQQKVDVGNVAVIGEVSPCAAGDVSGISNDTLLIGGIAAAAGAGLIIALSGDDDDEPTTTGSPLAP